MGFGTPPTVLEGDYLDWSIYDSFDDTDLSAGEGRQGAIINKIETEILLLDAWTLKAKRYTITTKTLTELAGADHQFTDLLAAPSTTRIYSAYSTYLVALIWNLDGIRIYKDGVVVKSFTYTELGMNDGTVYSVDISPLGKYVVVSGQRTSTGNLGWVVLVGS